MENKQIIDNENDLIPNIRLIKDPKTGLFYSPDLTMEELMLLDKEWC